MKTHKIEFTHSEKPKTFTFKAKSFARCIEKLQSLAEKEWDFYPFPPDDNGGFVADLESCEFFERSAGEWVQVFPALCIKED